MKYSTKTLKLRQFLKGEGISSSKARRILRSLDKEERRKRKECKRCRSCSRRHCSKRRASKRKSQDSPIIEPGIFRKDVWMQYLMEEFCSDPADYSTDESEVVEVTSTDPPGLSTPTEEASIALSTQVPDPQIFSIANGYRGKQFRPKIFTQRRGKHPPRESKTGGQKLLFTKKINKSKWMIDKWGNVKEKLAPQSLIKKPTDSKTPPVVPSEKQQNIPSSSVEAIEEPKVEPIDRCTLLAKSTETCLSDVSEDEVIIID